MITGFSPYDAAIADLKAKRSEIDKAISELEKMRAMFGGTSIAAEAAQPNYNEFEVMSAAEAAVLFLKSLPPKTPVATSVLIKTLVERGVNIDDGSGSGHLTKALERRAEGHRDIFRVARGKWALRSWYSEVEQAELERKVREADAHARRTVEGLEKARERGSSIGRKQIISAGHISAFKNSRAFGNSIAAACKEAGFSTGYYGYYRKEIEMWKEGAPWPPKEQNAGDASAENETPLLSQTGPSEAGE